MAPIDPSSQLKIWGAVMTEIRNGRKVSNHLLCHLKMIHKWSPTSFPLFGCILLLLLLNNAVHRLHLYYSFFALKKSLRKDARIQMIEHAKTDFIYMNFCVHATKIPFNTICHWSLSIQIVWILLVVFSIFFIEPIVRSSNDALQQWTAQKQNPNVYTPLKWQRSLQITIDPITSRAPPINLFHHLSRKIYLWSILFFFVRF